MKRRTILAAALAMLACAAYASGTTYYVSTSGSDGWPGSQAQPWLTLQHAVDTIASGDTILVTPGTYAGCRIRYSGSSGSPKTLAAQTPGTVLVSQPGSACRRPSNIEIISDDYGTSPTAYWVIEGIESANSPKWGFDGINADHLTIRDCVAHNAAITGIFSAFGDYNLIENCTSYSNGEHGFYVNNSSDNGVLRNNVGYSNVSLGVHMNGDLSSGGDGVMSYWTLEKNIMYQNGSNGFDADGCEFITWKNNVAWGNVSKGIHLTGADGSVTTRDTRTLNNTLVSPSTGYYAWNLIVANGSLPGPRNNKVFNNILYCYNTGWGRGGLQTTTFSLNNGWESDYNVLTGVTGIDDNAIRYTFAQWQALGYDLHSIYAPADTALWVDPANHDYHLKVGSPAIDAGTTLADVSDDIEGNSRPDGGAYDMGAYEYQGGVIYDLVITTTSLPNGTVGTAYSQALAATGGVTPYTWSLYSGSLPAGLSLSSAGVISGTPTTAQTANFTVQVTDSQNPADTDTQALSIQIVAVPVAPTITTTSLPSGRRNVAYSATVQATGGVTPYTWSIVSGSLPTGLSLNASTGTISGTPTKKGTKSFTVRCSDSQVPPGTDDQPLSITIS